MGPLFAYEGTKLTALLLYITSFTSALLGLTATRLMVIVSAKWPGKQLS